jgi:hypothetical protein
LFFVLDIVRDADRVVQSLKSKGPYFAIHIRSYYTVKEHIAMAFQCINDLIAKRYVHKVFVATDLDDYEAYARSVISDKSAFASFKKISDKIGINNLQFKNDNDGLLMGYDPMKVRLDMKSALIDYQVLSQVLYFYPAYLAVLS